jgi:hypothetical protein
LSVDDCQSEFCPPKLGLACSQDRGGNNSTTARSLRWIMQRQCLASCARGNGRPLDRAWSWRE